MSLFGCALLGAVEEASEADVRAEFDTNFFGALAVILTVLPLLRQQGSGHILGVSSVAGVGANAITGFSHPSKWAFEALHESLSKEVAGFGIKLTLIEPGAYATEFASQSSLKIAAGIGVYVDQTGALGSGEYRGVRQSPGELGGHLQDHRCRVATPTDLSRHGRPANRAGGLC